MPLWATKSLNRLVWLFLWSASSWLAAGCSQPQAVVHPDVVHLSPVVMSPGFKPPEDRSLPRIAIAIGTVSVAVPIAGERRAFEQTVQANLTEVLQQSWNFDVIDRYESGKIEIERELREANARASGGRNSKQAIATADYLISATVTTVDRNIQGGQTNSRATFVVDVKSGEEERRGVVEISFNLVDAVTSRSVFTFRTAGLLSDSKRESGGSFAGFGSVRTTFTRVPESQAIQSACEDASVRLFDFVKSMGNKVAS